MSNKENWEKIRASLLPIFYVIAFLFLFGLLNDHFNNYNYDQNSKYRSWIFLWIGFGFMIPGAIFGFYIYKYVNILKVPKKLLMFYSFLSFLQSIAWIKFLSGFIVDLLKILGIICRFPQALISLTILTWGNRIGDITADYYMSKAGCGEMAVTATVAGPIFNILVG
jgi:Ca2+/Na+ antiporter